MKSILLSLLLIGCVQCGKIAPDISSISWVGAGYYSSHMHFQGENYWGILPVNLKENEPLPRDSIAIKLFHTGTIHFFSRACELNYSARFTGNYLFKIPYIRNCEIIFNVMPDPVKGMEHEYTEMGKIITYVRMKDEWSLLINNKLQQDAIQVVEGNPSEYQKVNIKTYSQSGVFLATSSTGKQIEREYNEGNFSLPLQQLWCNNSCTWFFKCVPYDEPLTRVGRFDINTYKPILPLERPEPTFRDGRLYLRPMEYIIAIAINDKQYFNENIDMKYEENKEYEITWITKSGRKAVSIYRGSKLYWSSN